MTYENLWPRLILQQGLEQVNILSTGIEWLYGGKTHRECGPAVISCSGTKEWWKRGKRHRENGPAIISENGSQFWYRNHRLHRTKGPAITYQNGTQFWYTNGKRVLPKS